MKLKNKILSAFMIVAASMTLVSVSAFAASVGYEPSNITVKAGEEFTVDLVTADVEDLCSVGFFVTGSNETFTLVSAVDTALYPDPVHSQSTAGEDFYFSWNLDGTFSTGSDVSGVVAKLTYKVNENVAPGNYTIVVSSDENATFDLNEEDPFTTLNKLNVTVEKDAPATTDKAYYAEVTYGEKAKAATGIKFNLSTDDEKAKSMTAEKDVPFKAVVEAIEKIAVGLNIQGIPNGVTVTVDSAELY